MHWVIYFLTCNGYIKMKSKHKSKYDFGIFHFITRDVINFTNEQHEMFEHENTRIYDSLGDIKHSIDTDYGK